jgi:hypothetical protein
MPLNPIDYLSSLWATRRLAPLALTTIGPLLVLLVLVLVGTAR